MNHFRLLLPLVIASLFAGCASARTPSSGPAATYDIVIANGKVIDGTGNAWFYGDVGITGDRITYVGPAGSLGRTATKHYVEARGLVVAPGFIDIQSHSWDQLLWRDGRVLGKVTQGVTTEILGESTTPGPANDAVLELLEIPDTLPPLRALHETFRGARGFGAWLDAM